MVTDPPYNIDYGNAEDDRREATGYEKINRQILNDKMSDANFYKFLLDFYKAAFGIIKGGGAFYVFHSTKELVNFNNACKAAGFKISQSLVWVKNHFTLGRNDYQWQHEPIFVNSKVYNSTVNGVLERYCKKLNLPIISIHGLRHTHASLLLFAGVSIASVARRLGHASMTTTQKTYLHIIQELENKDIDLVMRSLSGLC